VIDPVETFVSVADLPADAAELWDTSLFGSRLWWETVLAAAMPAGTTACFMLCRIRGRPAALFPMRRPAGRSAFESLTTPYTCLYAPLLAGWLSAAEGQAVFRAFGAVCRGWALTRLDAMAAEWPFLPALTDGVGGAGLIPLRFDHFGNWTEHLGTDGWAGYLAARPGALRETIRRRLRRAERMADAAFTVFAGPAGLAAGIASFESVYDRSWKDPEPFPAFNAALMRATAAAGTLRLGVWSVGAQAVAAQVWVVEHKRATVLKLAHDEAFKAHSPGTVLTALMLRRLLDDEGVREIDFGRGDDAYKRGWARDRRQRIGIVFANPWRVQGLRAIGRHVLGRLRAYLAPRNTG